jgi:hypothetical protein
LRPGFPRARVAPDDAVVARAAAPSSVARIVDAVTAQIVCRLAQ